MPLDTSQTQTLLYNCCVLLSDMYGYATAGAAGGLFFARLLGVWFFGGVFGEGVLPCYDHDELEFFRSI